MRVSFNLFRYFGKSGCDTSFAMNHERWSLRDVLQQCKLKRLSVEPEHRHKSLMPGWSVFYGLRNDSPANACCRRCASLQNKNVPHPIDTVGDWKCNWELTWCTWARLHVGKFRMQNINIYFHCFIHSLWSRSHLKTWTEIRWPWVVPTWYINWLYYQNLYFGSTIPCLAKLVSLNPWLDCHIGFIRFNHIW